jgi:uncharacterized DUF497 family protein
MHPRDAEGFEWDDENAAHLSQPHHPISEDEAEDVFYNGPVWVPHRRKRERWKMIGYTDGGRALTILVDVKVRTRQLRAFTGWECTPSERTRYLS